LLLELLIGVLFAAWLLRRLVRALVTIPALAAMKAARRRALEMSWDRIFDDVCGAYATAISVPVDRRRESGGAVVTGAGASRVATGL
jgi:hypothetical protein